VGNHFLLTMVRATGCDRNGLGRWEKDLRIVVVDGGTNGYWWVGTTGVFTTDRTGKLWFGFNDDAVSGRIDDDSGAVFGEVTITH
jgi:hypothetical protein